MKIERIKHNNIDFLKWDKTILSSQIPYVFAQAFYLNATCPNWDALVIGDYESIFPLTYKNKFGINYLPQPPFTSQLGVYGKVNLETEQYFYDYLLQHYKLIDLELNSTNKIQSIYISSKNTYTIDYNLVYNFNQNSKRNITKAIDHRFIVERVNDQDILALSQKFINPFLANEVNLSNETISLLDKLLINAKNEHAIFTFKVIDDENNIKALAHFICNGKHALYLKGTNFDKADNSGSMHLLMKYAIEFFSDKAEIFDFGGGSKQGLANFYMGLGGQAKTYGFLQVNRLPWLIKIFKNKK